MANNYSISMSDSDKERWAEPLREYYRKKETLTEDQIEKEITRVFAEVQVGWNRAPSDLDTRIKMKTGFQWKSHANLKPNWKEVDEGTPAVVEEAENDSNDASDKFMQKWEIEFRDTRLQEYAEDFDFNESSDKLLLYQLVTEEIIQQKLVRLQFQNPKQDYNKRLTDNLKRITDIQQRLGITREQRAGVLDKMDGNVAQLAVSLEEKLKAMPDKLRQEYQEIVHYRNLKDQRPPENVLPPIEKIEALLSVGGKITANLQSDKISEIVEEVGKEISNQDPPPKKTLPEGVDIG